jgi:hypothetical protein
MLATHAMLAVLSCCATYPHDDQETAPIASSALAEDDKIRPYCEQQWAGDLSAIAFCVERQWAGYRKLLPSE